MAILTSVDGLVIDARGPVLSATLAAPNGNQVSPVMADALIEVLTAPPTDAHVLVLRAVGEAFCLGRDRAATGPGALSVEVDRLVRLNQALVTTSLVTIAEVHGDAAGFGAGLAALADVSVATESARFWFPEIGIGLAPTLVLAWLERMVGRREAFWLTATGERVPAVRALQLGLLNEVVTDQKALSDAVERRVAELVAHPRRVHAEIKSMLRAASALSPEQAGQLAASRLVVGSLRLGG